MSKFLFLFRSQQNGARPPSPEAMQRTMQLWMDWIDGIKKNGNLVATGDRLDLAGKVVRGRAKSVTDGPYAETKDTVGGYMLVQAQDLAEAVEISKGCPIFEADGSVEVRPIFAM